MWKDASIEEWRSTTAQSWRGQIALANGLGYWELTRGAVVIQQELVAGAYDPPTCTEQDRVTAGGDRHGARRI